MTNHRELIERAAKAMGYMWDADYEIWYSMNAPVRIGWNPLTNPGDCAEMEDAKGISVRWHSYFVQCGNLDDGSLDYTTEAYADHGGDRGAARRMASTRAAGMIEGEK